MSTSASNQTNPPTPPPAPDPMEAALRQAAQGLDHGQEVTDDAILKATTGKEEGKAAGAETGNENTASDGSERKADTDPASKKDEGKDGKDKKEPTEGKEDSKIEKAKKEEARQKEVLSGFTKKQEALKQKEIEIERRERAILERERATPRRVEPLKDKLGYTAKEYEEAAAQWEKAGNFELADLAKENARKLRDAEKTEAQRGTEQRGPEAKPETTPGTPQFQKEWVGNLDRLKGTKEYGDLENTESELFKTTAEILKTEPRLSMHNDGIVLAAEIARLRLEAGSVPALRKQLTEQTQELEKLRKATTPGAGDAESRGTTKTFETMTAAEQEAELRRSANEHDNGG